MCHHDYFVLEAFIVVCKALVPTWHSLSCSFAGVSRSATVMIAYLMYSQRLAYEDAWSQVFQRCPRMENKTKQSLNPIRMFIITQTSLYTIFSLSKQCHFKTSHRNNKTLSNENKDQIKTSL